MTARLLALLGLSLAVAQASPALAHRPPPPRASVDVELMCDGRACEEVRAHGQRYVVGEYGGRYTIALSNRSDGWVEAVVSVDGRSVVDGRRQSSASRGYLLAPYQRVELEGWRVDSSQVAAFRFTSVGDSYAGRTGDSSQAGTIRVDVYGERRRAEVWVPPPRPRYYEEDGDARPSPSPEATKSERAGAAMRGDDRWRDDRGQNLGTQYGESRWQPVEQRDFERASSQPAQVVSLRYDDRRGLAARGIIGWREWDDRDVHWVPPPPPLRIDD